MKSNNTFIVAEAGVNHNGEIELAYQLIDKAVEAQVDAIKFQSFKTIRSISKLARKAHYQIKNTNSSESQFEMARKLELNEDTHRLIIDYCKLLYFY